MEQRRTGITIAELLNPVEDTGSAAPAHSHSPNGVPANGEQGVQEDEYSSEDSSDSEDKGLFRGFVRCPGCMKVCHYKHLADHRKEHFLKGTEGVAVPAANKCNHCMKRGHQCIVAKQPCQRELNTVRCLNCIVNKEACSFVKTYKHLPMSSMNYHPARMVHH
ncbi:hypothetical protein VFPPC_13043 [Pochonia chlamydosporia 170]|uniref:Uncharacterized protein n=1 Tax=Pochonia chlamydosporia 170 TaxID=1380566 RepID=A0A179G753_METCM|nr:hypothetical protein VFPPC_13043 [Pochonia chlamydosporia 170]OAQ73627.1 hypothetical protein VFPPC_13043 [Pochonia chlamydosporia 170]